MDVRQSACETCGSIKKPSDDFIKGMIGPLLVCTKDKNTAVRSRAEQAIIDILDLNSPDNNRMKVIIIIIFVTSTNDALTTVLYELIG